MSNRFVSVGINEWIGGSRIPSLRYAERDAERMAEAMDTLGFEPVVLLGCKATRTRMLETIRRPGRGGLCVFLFAGHAESIGGAYYLHPYDGEAGSTLGSINFGDLQRHWGRPDCGFSQCVAMLDACRSTLGGAGLRGPRGLTENETRDIATVSESLENDVRVLYGCDLNQCSHEFDDIEHGLLTYHLLAVINARRSKGLTLRDLIDEAADEMQEWLRKHRPTVRQAPKTLWTPTRRRIYLSHPPPAPPPKPEPPADVVSFAHRAKQRFETARALQEQGHLVEAARIYAIAATLYAEAGDRERQGLSLHKQAGCCLRNKNSDRDCVQAKNLYARAAAIRKEAGDKEGQGGSLLGQAWCCHPDRNPDGSWEQAKALYARAATMFKEAGNKKGQGGSIHQQAVCSLPHYNPDGDWDQAEALFAQAATIFEETGDKKAQGKSLYQQAWCCLRDKNSDRNWEQAKALFAQAAAVCEEAGDKKWQGANLHLQAMCCMPHLNPDGGWEQAEALLARAATVFETENDKKVLGSILYMQALCLIEGKAKNMSDMARGMFRKAARLQRKAGDEDGARQTESWLN